MLKYLTPSIIDVSWETQTDKTTGKVEAKLKVKIAQVIETELLAHAKHKFEVHNLSNIFVAPENKLSPACDVYSLGVLIYLSVTGGRDSIKRKELLKFKEPAFMSSDSALRDFIEKCICGRPGKRWTVEQLLEHQIFKKMDARALPQTPIDCVHINKNGQMMLRYHLSNLMDSLTIRVRMNIEKLKQFDDIVYEAERTVHALNPLEE